MGTLEDKQQAREKLQRGYKLIQEAVELDPDATVALTASVGDGRFLLTRGNDYLLLGMIDEMHGIAQHGVVRKYMKAALEEQSRIVKPQMAPLNGGRR